MKNAWHPPSLKLPSSLRQASPRQAGVASCPWQIEYEGALYHVFSRGNDQDNIFLTDDDLFLILDTIGQISERFENDIRVLQCDLEKIKDCARISESDKLNRDILLYWLWQESNYTNLQIGELFGLTHSSVSRRVTIIRKKVALEQNFLRQIETIKSQIKP